jgi:hypothetical protein
MSEFHSLFVRVNPSGPTERFGHQLEEFNGLVYEQPTLRMAKLDEL